MRSNVVMREASSPRPDIEQRLSAFLRGAAARSFGMGEFDCGLLVADWCLEVRGRDPAAAIRARYDSLEEACALVGVSSLPRLFDTLLRGAGLKRTRRPAYGDVAVIKIGDSELRGAILTSGYVVIAAGGGLSRVAPESARRVCSWSIDA